MDPVNELDVDAYRELVDNLGGHALVDIVQAEEEGGPGPLHLWLARFFCKNNKKSC
jgi:hypothetical protein